MQTDKNLYGTGPSARSIWLKGKVNGSLHRNCEFRIIFITAFDSPILFRKSKE